MRTLRQKKRTAKVEAEARARYLGVPLSVYVRELDLAKGHFDRDYYLATHSDVALAGVDPDVHFFGTGLLEGRTYAIGMTPSWATESGKKPGVEVSEHSSVELGPFHGLWNVPPQMDGVDAKIARQVSFRLHGKEVLLWGAVERLVATASLVSFDLWGTLVLRDRHPDEVKLIGARRLCELMNWSPENSWSVHRKRCQTEGALATSFSNRDTQFGEFKIHEVWITTLQALGIADLELAKDLCESEQQYELDTTRPNWPVVALLNASRRAGRPTGIVSDTYYSSHFLVRLLQYHNIDISGVEVMASCDYGTSKRWGDLLSKFRSMTPARGNLYVHMGDSQDADIEAAQRAHAIGIQVNVPLESAVSLPEMTLDSEASDALSRQDERYHLVARLASRQAATASAAFRDSGDEARLAGLSRLAKQSGLTLGPCVGALVVAASRGAQSSGRNVLHYVSREGIFFARVHDAMARDGRLQLTDCRHLAVSRLSTFLPSLNEVSVENLMLMWRQYSTQSPAEFLASLGMAKLPETRQLLREFEGDAEEAIKEPWQDERFALFLDRPFARDFLERRRILARQGLASYLAKQGLWPQTGFSVADVGWRGSIQDNLSRFLDAESSGVYLGVLSRLNASSNSTKVGLLFDEVRPSDAAYFGERNSTIEKMLTPNFPPVDSYTPTGELVLGAPMVIRQVSDQLLSAFHEGIVQGAVLSGRSLAGMNDERLLEHCSRFARLALRNTLENPNSATATIIRGQAHEENFGVMNTRPDQHISSDWPELHALLR